jgi:hypothetical protein
MKSSGPMTLPCGTPDLTLRKDEETPSITTRCFRLWR